MQYSSIEHFIAMYMTNFDEVTSTNVSEYLQLYLALEGKDALKEVVEEFEQIVAVSTWPKLAAHLAVDGMTIKDLKMFHKLAKKQSD